MKKITTMRDDNLNPHIVDVLDEYGHENILKFNNEKVQNVDKPLSLCKAQKYCDNNRVVGVYDTYTGIVLVPREGVKLFHNGILTEVKDIEDNVDYIQSRFILLSYIGRTRFELYVEDIMYQYEVSKKLPILPEEYNDFLEYVSSKIKECTILSSHQLDLLKTIKSQNKEERKRYLTEQHVCLLLQD